MPVLLIAEADLPEEAYAEIAGKMTPLIREGQGLNLPCGQARSGWRVAGRRDLGVRRGRPKWFDHNIMPNLPPGVVPKQAFYPLRTAVTR